MDYNYESLLDERFQMVCQSLLLRTYPGLQCLPTRMPDGGRDGVLIRPDKATIVFQVKYSRDPAKVDNAAKWVIKALEAEIPKVIALRESGTLVEEYIIITNVRGSSHPDTGSIDIVQKYLNEHLTIPARCWWRDDLDRRLDNEFDLKLKYPDLMSGTDAFRLMWTLLGDSEDRKRRENALRAYMGHYYEQESKIKFKQVGLVTSSLFDLFIDVPVRIEHMDPRQHVSHSYVEAVARLARIRVRDFSSVSEAIEADMVQIEYSFASRYYTSEQNYFALHEMLTGATEILLDPDFMATTPIVVLEGAPGQGKSTLSQFLMQLHRCRLLELEDEMSALSQQVVHSPIMLPIKLELRDLALWLGGIDPWSVRQAESHSQTATLETAIAAHIQRYSGGVDFSVADLLASLEETPALIVLDALDEVADLDDRGRVVEEVKAAMTRLRQRNKGIRFIITSRPTAIAKSPSFRDGRIIHLSLAPITERLAVDYAGRWAGVRGLDNKDTAELLGVLRQRLQSQHIAELAKNTMQLTILLNLISLRGPGLPDKRTDLYNTYFEVFMDRESEKDVSVRDNREFLVDLHAYLAYCLHARAEANRSNGRITTDELKGLIQGYMAKQRQSSDLLATMTRAVDRIFAVVSRVEGMWEFEVQPLQEYFAARYLYDTAPYSPVGNERTGTKPDIFDGIAPNPYWLNVTRFYAGCFSKGELLDLSDRVASLISADSSYARSLGIALVQDWVFTQSTRATDVVIASVFDAIGLRWASSSGPRDHTGPIVPIAFSRSRDAQAVVDLAWPLMCSSPLSGKIELCSLIIAQNLSSYVRERWEREFLEKAEKDKLEWIATAGYLHLFPRMDKTDVHRLIIDDVNEDRRAAAAGMFLRAGGNSNLLPEPLTFEAIKYALDHENHYGPLSPESWLLDSQIWMSMVLAFAERGRGYYAEPFLQVLGKFKNTEPNNPSLEYTLNVASRVGSVLTQRLTPQDAVAEWSEIVTSFTDNFGQSFFSNELAVMAGCIRAGRQRGNELDLFNHATSLVARVRYAKSQLNRPTWWMQQSVNVAGDYDRHLWLLCLYAWASPGTIVSIVDEVERQLATMQDSGIASLLSACRRASTYSQRARADFSENESERLKSIVGPATICMLYHRLRFPVAVELVAGNLAQSTSAGYAGNAILDVTGRAISAGVITNEHAVRLMTLGYGLGADRDCSLRHARTSYRMSVALASRILSEGASVPTDALVSAMDAVESSRSNPDPVMHIAERDRWFGADG